MKSEYHILSLGAGVQSTTLYLMFLRKQISVPLDAAIFADTQEEPAAVYEHLEWLQSLNGPPVLTGTAGKLGNDLTKGTNTTGGRVAAIPAFTTTGNGEVGRTKRQCSKEYKTDVIGRVTRRVVLGLRPRQPIPRGVTIHQYIGISLDEAGRAQRLKALLAETQKRTVPHFPLIDLFWTRNDCRNYLEKVAPERTVPRSACVMCPYHSDAEWAHLKVSDPAGWQRAVAIDHKLRAPEAVVNRDMRQTMYLHRSCQPLDLVEFDTRPKPKDLQLAMSFAQECEGVCGV